MIGVTGGASGSLEPVMLRSRAARRDVMCWKRGETTASPGASGAVILTGVTIDDLPHGDDAEVLDLLIGIARSILQRTVCYG